MEAGTSLFKRILVGIDGHGRSGGAVARGADFATRFDAQFELVHAAAVAPIAWADVESGAAPPMAATENLEALRTRLLARFGDILSRSSEARVRVVRGDPALVLAEEARAFDATLIVIGPHERRGWVDIGSTALGLLSRCSAPVWIEPGSPGPIERVIAAIDLSARSARVLELARDVALAHAARVEAVHVFDSRPLAGVGPIEDGSALTATDAEGLRRSVRLELDREVDRIDWRGVVHSARIEDGSPATRLFAAGASADLLVLGTHGRSPLAAVILGGTARAIVRSSAGPVLVQRM